MKAIVLAAGLGARLRPITDKVPKPLLQAGGKSLIEYQLLRLKRAGISDVVINVHHLADLIRDELGDGSALGLRIRYSHEPELLETGGGIKKALPLLGDEPFLVTSADTYLDFDLTSLPGELPPGILGILVMTDNPPHHPEGDFALDSPHGGQASIDTGSLGQYGTLRLDGGRMTYTGTAILHPDLVRDVPDARFMLREVFDRAIAAGKLLGIRHEGYWCDVGTEERLLALRDRLEKAAE